MDKSYRMSVLFVVAVNPQLFLILDLKTARDCAYYISIFQTVPCANSLG